MIGMFWVIVGDWLLDGVVDGILQGFIVFFDLNDFYDFLYRFFFFINLVGCFFGVCLVDLVLVEYIVFYIGDILSYIFIKFDYDVRYIWEGYFIGIVFWCLYLDFILYSGQVELQMGVIVQDGGFVGCFFGVYCLVVVVNKW